MDYKLCLGTGMGFSVPVEEQIRIIKKAGFDGFFTEMDSMENLVKYAEIAKEENLIFQSVHAPFGKMYLIWEGSDKEAQRVTDELKACVDACAGIGVPLLICHVTIGMERCTPNEIGALRFRNLCEYAKEKGIKIAFENTEGEEYLQAVMEKCKDLENVGFCFDSGHEMCYNGSRDMLSLYGNRLFATHLNDNMGMKDEKIKTWYDDLHLLPFDGIADWENIAERLKKSTCPRCLTFELVSTSKPERDYHRIYEGMTFFDYVKEAHRRAEKVRSFM